MERNVVQREFIFLWWEQYLWGLTVDSLFLLGPQFWLRRWLQSVSQRGDGPQDCTFRGCHSLPGLARGTQRTWLHILCWGPKILPRAQAATSMKCQGHFCKSVPWSHGASLSHTLGILSCCNDTIQVSFTSSITKDAEVWTRCEEGEDLAHVVVVVNEQLCRKRPYHPSRPWGRDPGGQYWRKPMWQPQRALRGRCEAVS